VAVAPTSQLESQPSGVDELIVRTGLTAAQVMAT
jgi:hypothetical protein